MSSSILPTVDVDQIEHTRRTVLTRRLALVFSGVIALFLLLAVALDFVVSRILLLELLMLVGYTLTAWITTWRRNGYAAELLVAVTLLHGLVESIHIGGVLGMGPGIFFVALVLGAMLVRWRFNLIFGIVAILMVLLLAVLSDQGILAYSSAAAPSASAIYSRAIVYMLLLGVVCLIACINARSHQQALRQMAAQSTAVRTQTEQLIAQGALVQRQAAELEQHRARLEHEVAERTADLSRALAELRESAITLQELQSPLVPIADGVLVMPLVGSFDSARATQFVQALLRGIEQRRAHTVLLDVTGLPVMDTLAAQTLLQASRAAKLLGATIQLVGVTPGVAQTIVGLGLDLSMLHVERDLQSAVAGVLAAPLLQSGAARMVA
jgi:rsbT co-antagonist protein RsbR